MNKNCKNSVEIPYDEHPDIFRDSSRVGSWWGELSEGSAKVLIVADNAEKMALREHILGDSRVHVTGVAQRLGDACRALRNANYDVVLIALSSHNADMRALLQLMDLHQPKARAVVILGVEEGAGLQRLYGPKVMGYLSYEDIAQHMVPSLLEVAQSRFTVSPGLSTVVMHLLDRHPASSGLQDKKLWQSSRPGPVFGASVGADSGVASIGVGVGTGVSMGMGMGDLHGKSLSRRELEILRMVAAGHVTAGIADALSISAATVNAHMRNIFIKMGCKTRAQAIHFGIQTGMFDESDGLGDICINAPKPALKEQQALH